MTSIEFDKAWLSYGEHHALRDVELSILPGTFTALIGPNGSGKTSLLRLACGWRRPSAGRVHVGGVDVGRMHAAERARLVGGMVGAEQAVFPFSVTESVMLGRYAWRGNTKDATTVDRVLSRTGLEAFAHRSVTTLSAGERQRVGIARALAQSPDIYVLDEPTSHLDVGQALKMAAVFREEVHERGKAVVAVFHDINLAAWTADEIVLLDKGRVLARGSTRDVLTKERLEQVFDAELSVTCSSDDDRVTVVPALPHHDSKAVAP